ncbi:MAG: hypothetical protein ACKO96_09210 [Flammeovirgaceae bacterium]
MNIVFDYLLAWRVRNLGNHKRGIDLFPIRKSAIKINKLAQNILIERIIAKIVNSGDKLVQANFN